MNEKEKLSFDVLEAIQKISDIETALKKETDESTEALKTQILSRHDSLNLLLQDGERILSSIKAVVDGIEKKQIEREKLVKKITYKKLEVLIDSVVHQETRRREGLMKGKQDFRKAVVGLNKDIIETAGAVLNIAKKEKMYFPFVLNLVRHTMLLSATFEVFIPLSYYLLFMLDAMSKINPSTAPLQPIREDAVKVQDKQTNTSVFKEYVMHNALDLLASDLKMHSNSLSFPEYSSFIASELKRIRNSPNKSTSWLCSKMQGMVKTIRDHTEKVLELRKGLSVLDEDLVEKIEKTIPPLKIEIDQ